MLTAYPETSSGCSDEYLATLAQTLCQFPLEVATAACSPVHGVPKEQKNFRPTAGQIHEWCTREAGFLYRMAEREGLLQDDSHKTYSGTFIKATYYATGLPPDAKEVATAAEKRRAHVERLRKEGRLTFDAGPEAERRKSFFDRLTKDQAEKILADYANAAQPFEAPDLGPVPF
jgi:hypothetical protein